MSNIESGLHQGEQLPPYITLEMLPLPVSQQDAQDMARLYELGAPTRNTKEEQQARIQRIIDGFTVPSPDTFCIVARDTRTEKMPIIGMLRFSRNKKDASIAMLETGIVDHESAYIRGIVGLTGITRAVKEAWDQGYRAIQLETDMHSSEGAGSLALRAGFTLRASPSATPDDSRKVYELEFKRS